MCRQPLMNSFSQAQTPIHEDDSSLNVIDIRHPRKCIRWASSSWSLARGLAALGATGVLAFIGAPSRRSC